MRTFFGECPSVIARLSHAPSRAADRRRALADAGRCAVAGRPRAGELSIRARRRRAARKESAARIIYTSESSASRACLAPGARSWINHKFGIARASRRYRLRSCRRRRRRRSIASSAFYVIPGPIVWDVRGLRRGAATSRRRRRRARAASGLCDAIAYRRETAAARGPLSRHRGFFVRKVARR